MITTLFCTLQIIKIIISVNSQVTRPYNKSILKVTMKLNHSFLLNIKFFTDAAKEQKKKDRGERETKTITVETYASVLIGPNSDTGILPTSSRRSPPEDSISEDEETISFFCGNPLVEVTKGVLHLYKEK